ncbi:hypothetical protein CITRIK5_70371 [Citricoccus sp. K5]|nr:hypothetical protein CITRIK5_70371 [Citricoccus sp. K5]
MTRVREGGLEPPRPFEHWHLKPARLPIPPLARGFGLSSRSKGLYGILRTGQNSRIYPIPTVTDSQIEDQAKTNRGHFERLSPAWETALKPH